MAQIHRTTMTPDKIQLLTAWLPRQPWYRGEGEPELERTGGFRLDDPAGEVGIEFMAVTDTSGAEPVTYHCPLSYRAAPLDGAGAGLLGTSEHGVLGTRWIHDGAYDPVFLEQLLALLSRRAEPQAQRISDTPDPTVTVEGEGPTEPLTLAGTGVEHGRRFSELRLVAGEPGAPGAPGAPGSNSGSAGSGSPSAPLLLVHRVLEPQGAQDPGQRDRTASRVTATWTRGQGSARGAYASLQFRR